MNKILLFIFLFFYSWNSNAQLDHNTFNNNDSIFFDINVYNSQKELLEDVKISLIDEDSSLIELSYHGKINDIRRYILYRKNYPKYYTRQLRYDIHSPGILIKAKGYKEETVLLNYLRMDLYVFKKSERHSYQSAFGRKSPYTYQPDILMVMMINANDTMRLQFLIDSLDLKIVKKYPYCGYGMKGMSEEYAKEIFDDTYVLSKNTGTFNTGYCPELSIIRSNGFRNTGPVYLDEFNRKTALSRHLSIHFLKELEAEKANELLQSYGLIFSPLRYKQASVSTQMPDNWNYDKIIQVIDSMYATGLFYIINTEQLAFICF